MSPFRQKRAIYAVAIGLAVSAVGILAWALLAPVQVESAMAEAGDPRCVSQAATSQPASPPVADTVSLDELATLCAIDYRHPLFDPPVVTQAGVQPTVPAMTAVLVGLADEPGHAIAMFQKSDGAVALCGVGESFDDVAGPVCVVRISPPGVTVQYAGIQRELLLAPRNGDAP